MSTPAITVEDLLLALDAAAYAVGDVVEFCALQRSAAPLAMRFARTDEDLVRAAQWIRWQAVSQGRDHADGRATEGGLYLGSNPLLTASGHRASDADVREVRLLLLDLDPVDVRAEARAAAAQRAEELLRLLTENAGVRPSLIDSGRGRQVWLRHVSINPSNGEVLGLRRRLLYALAARLDGDLAKIDRSTHNPSRLMRLPGTMNLRTGDHASVLDPGDKRILTLEDLERLVRALEPSSRAAPPAGLPPAAPQPPTSAQAVDPSTTARRGAEQDLDELCALVAQLPSGDPTWAWLGAQAVRAGVVDLARPALPPAATRAYDAAAVAATTGARWPAPTSDASLRQRVVRALQGLRATSEPTEAPVRVARVVHYRRARSLGGHYDLEVATVRGAVVIRDVPGKELRSYASIAARALDGGLLLPDLPRRRASAIWLDALTEALERRDTVELPEAGEDEVAIEDEIRTFVAAAPRGDGVDALDQGEVIETEGRALVAPKALVRAVRDALPEAPPTRAAILRVAERLGGRVERSRYVDGQRRQVVGFLVEPSPPTVADASP